MRTIKGIIVRMFAVIGLFLALTAASYATMPKQILDEEWKFTVSPYLWGLSMNGRVGVGSQKAHIDQSFSDILEKLNIAGMLWLDAHHGRFGVFFNSLYASMSDSANKGLLSVHDRNSFTLISGGLSYRVFDYCFGSSLQNTNLFFIEPYAGFRYTANQVSLDFNLPGFSVTVNNDQYWTDPIVGARLVAKYNNGFEASLAGDVGGVNTSSQYSYNLIGLLGYQPKTILKNSTWYLGYRILDQVYVTGSGINRFDWNMKLTGPLIGAAFTF